MTVYVVEVGEATRCWVFGVFETISAAKLAVDSNFLALSRLALEIYVCKADLNMWNLDGLEVVCGRYSDLDENDNEVWSDWQQE